MRNLKTYLTIAAVSTALLIGATTPTDTNNKQTTTEQKKATQKERIILLADRHQSHRRPQAPSRQRIGCEYDGQVLALDFVYPEGECNVTLTEYYSGAQQSYVIDSSDCYAEIPVGQIYESTVTLTTPSGTTYTCELTAD